MKPDDVIKEIRNGSIDKVKKLVDSGLDVNTKFESYDSLVSEAAYANQSRIVRFLIENGADIESKTSIGGTPLKWAITYGDVELVKFLCSKGADVNTSCYKIKILTHATSKGSVEIVKILLENGANPNTGDARYIEPAFLRAAMEGYIDIVKLLLKYKVNKYTARNEDALAAACRHNHVDVVKLLLTKGKFKLQQKKYKIGGDSTYHSPLEESCKKGHVDCARLLLEAGADPDFAFADQRQTPMIYAIMEGHLETVELLHKYGAKFEYNDRMHPNNNPYRSRKNPLGIACYYGKFDIVKYLVENGADPTIGVTYDGDYTPLDYAKNRGYTDIVEYLTKDYRNS